MRMVCVYTEQVPGSRKAAGRCLTSAKNFGYKVELFPSVYWKTMKTIHQQYGLKQKYIPDPKIQRLRNGKVPAARMANGTTHYLLYMWSVENQEPICIVEHDAVFVGKIPCAKPNGVIQISSHMKRQAKEEDIRGCHRANKMRQYQPNFKFVWDDTPGVIVHPLTGMNGTSGYIIHPGAAEKMVEYIQRDGIAQGDRVRTERIGEGNLYLQVPQSVICHHDVKSTYESRKNS